MTPERRQELITHAAQALNGAPEERQLAKRSLEKYFSGDTEASVKSLKDMMSSEHVKFLGENQVCLTPSASELDSILERKVFLALY